MTSKWFVPFATTTENLPDCPNLWKHLLLSVRAVDDDDDADNVVDPEELLPEVGLEVDPEELLPEVLPTFPTVEATEVLPTVVRRLCIVVTLALATFLTVSVLAVLLTVYFLAAVVFVAVFLPALFAATFFGRRRCHVPSAADALPTAASTSAQTIVTRIITCSNFSFKIHSSRVYGECSGPR